MTAAELINRAIRVYVVDDDPSVRKALKRLLSSSGFQVETFESALKFLENEHDADGACLVLDIQMSGMNGLELHEHLAKKGVHIPIVFITAYDDEKTRRYAELAGLPLLIKPFVDNSLIKAIRSSH